MSLFHKALPGVSVVKDAVKGNCLATSKDYEAGDEILTVDGVLIAYETGCIACNDKRCLSYCDAFRRYFLDLRTIINSVGDIVLATGTPLAHIFLAIKFIALRKTALPATHRLSHTDLDAIFELSNPRANHKSDNDDDRFAAEKILAALPSSHRGVLDKSQLAQFIGIVYSNAHAVPGGGVGLFPVAAMAEHSCCPNACYQVEEDRLSLVATETIKKDEHISISYIELYQSNPARLQELKLRYHFDCVCLRCKSDPLNRDMARAFVCENCEEAGSASVSASGGGEGVVAGVGGGASIPIEKTVTVGVPGSISNPGGSPRVGNVEKSRGGVVTSINGGTVADDWSCNLCGKGPSKERFQQYLSVEKALIATEPLDISVTTLLEAGIIHRSHYHIYRALRKRTFLLARLRPKVVQEWLVCLIKDARSVLPKNHPDLAMYFDQLGQVRRLLGDMKGAQKAFAECFAVREKTNGKMSALTQHAKLKKENPMAVDLSLWTSY